MTPPPLCATHFGKLCTTHAPPSPFGAGDVYKNIAKGCKTTAFGKLFIFNHLQFSAKLQVFLKLQKIFFRVFSPLLLRHTLWQTLHHTCTTFPLWGRRMFIHIVGAIGKSPLQNKTFSGSRKLISPIITNKSQKY